MAREEVVVMLLPPTTPTSRGPRLRQGVADAVELRAVVQLLSTAIMRRLLAVADVVVADLRLLARLPTLLRARRRLKERVATTAVAVGAKAVANRTGSRTRTAGSTSITIWSALSTPRCNSRPRPRSRSSLPKKTDLLNRTRTSSIGPWAIRIV